MTYLADRITVDPEQCGGRPCIRGLRIRVSDVLDLLANGLTPEKVVEELPDLELEDVRASLRFADPPQAQLREPHPVLGDILFHEDPSLPLDAEDWPEEES